jgi:hypothetical protein
MRPVAIEITWTGLGQVNMPDKIGLLLHGNSCYQFLPLRFFKETEFELIGAFLKHGKIYSLSIPGGPADTVFPDVFIKSPLVQVV